MKAIAKKTVTTKKGLTFTKGESYKCDLSQDGKITIYVTDFEFARASRAAFTKLFDLE